MVKRSQIWRTVDRLYVEIETALWAALAAFVIFLLRADPSPHPGQCGQGGKPRAPSRSFTRTQRYCEKWGMKRGTQAHIGCTIDLQRLRNDIELIALNATMFAVEMVAGHLADRRPSKPTRSTSWVILSPMA